MQNRYLGAAIAVAVSFGFASVAQATTYNSLVGGGQFGITPNSATFLGNVNEGSTSGVNTSLDTGFAGIDVTGQSGTDFAYVDLNFNQTLLDGDFLEANGSFDITVAGSSFEITGITLGLFGSGFVGSGSGFGFVEAATEDAGGTTDLLTEIVRENGETDIDDTNDARILVTPVETFTFNWSIQAENDGVDSMTLNFARFEVALRDTVPPPNVVPLPAGLPLLLAGLGALAFLRRRS